MFDWSYDPLGNRVTEAKTPLGGLAETTSYDYAPGTNRLVYTETIDPPLAATFEDNVLTLVYPEHRLPRGMPLQTHYYWVLDCLEWLLNRAAAGKKNVFI